MSNSSLVERMRSVVAVFETGQTSFVHLQDVLENSASALEALPYGMVLELRDIESRLVVERSYEEEKCESQLGAVLGDLKLWLERVPTNV